MDFKDGLVANNELELVAWSTVLAMNTVHYFIRLDVVDDARVFLIYTQKIDHKLKEQLEKQYRIQIEILQTVKL